MFKSGVRTGRRATADAPSTSGMADRIGLFTSTDSASNTSQFTENPFTSRPPSSASEIEFELGSSQHSTVSSPIPRPLTARGGRYSVDGGRSSADSYRRSSSIDHHAEPHPATPADVTAVIEDGFASDSSRPGSRLERPDSRNNYVRRSVVRVGGGSSAMAVGGGSAAARRNTLTRLLEEDVEIMTRERAASASMAVTSPSAYPRLSSPLSLPGRSPRADSDVADVDGSSDVEETDRGNTNGQADASSDVQQDDDEEVELMVQPIHQECTFFYNLCAVHYTFVAINM